MLCRSRRFREDEILTLLARIRHGVTSSLLRSNDPSRSLSFSPELHRHFSSSAGGDYISFFSRSGSDEDEGSPAYRLSAAYGRPPTQSRWHIPRNSCSFIGSVALPLKRFPSTGGVYTWIDVKRPPREPSDRPSSLRILLTMEDKLAEIAFRHLKQNDFIYVWGPLGSYTTVTGGKRRIWHKVIVKDLNYVKRNSQNSEETLHEPLVPLPGMRIYSAETPMLVFFASPHDWWDNRQDKPNPRRPDFKHKDTGECLTLGPSDPPWVRKQLELYDSKMASTTPRNARVRKFEVNEVLEL